MVTKQIGMRLDLEQAYDKVNWDFLIFILKSLGFDNNLLKLTQTCITCPLLRILIKVKQTKAFSKQRVETRRPPLPIFVFIYYGIFFPTF